MLSLLTRRRIVDDDKLASLKSIVMSWLAMSDWFLRSKEWNDWTQIDDSDAEAWLRNIEFFVDRTYTINETFVDWER